MTLEYNTRYFWRVDEESANGIQKGEVWSFETTFSSLGKCTREVWTNIQSREVDGLRADLRFPDNPMEITELMLFDSSSGIGDWQGARIRAWLHVPFTGTYTFKMSSYSNAELWLSTTPDDRTQTQLIVKVPIERLPRNDWRYSSEPINLEADQRYYIEALWVTTDYGDHCQVAWEGPGIRDIEVIQGGYVEPFEALWAFGPNPLNRAVDVRQTPTLRWKASTKAAQHDIYFGDDENAVADANTTTPGIYRGRQLLDDTIYVPAEAPLEWNKTYYWRIDEINDTNPDSPWRGAMWSFTTANFLVVDDFEGYNDIPAGEDGSNLIYETWSDGFTNPTINGSTIGYTIPFEPTMETVIVHGGSQSAPMAYNNAVGKSEVTLTLTEHDWTVNGVKTLTIWFRGEADNAAEALYVALNGSARIDNDSPDAALSTSWTEWNVPLQAFADQGVNLTNVNSITLGLSSVTGGTGIMYFDDIRLLRPL
jgi:hypothetical protein